MAKALDSKKCVFVFVILFLALFSFSSAEIEMETLFSSSLDSLPMTSKANAESFNLVLTVLICVSGVFLISMFWCTGLSNESPTIRRMRMTFEEARDQLIVHILALYILSVQSSSNTPIVIRSVRPSDFLEIFSVLLGDQIEDESTFNAVMLKAWCTRHRINHNIADTIVLLSVFSQLRLPWPGSSQICYIYDCNCHDQPPRAWTSLQGVFVVERANWSRRILGEETDFMTNLLAAPDGNLED